VERTSWKASARKPRAAEKNPDLFGNKYQAGESKALRPVGGKIAASAQVVKKSTRVKSKAANENTSRETKKTLRQK
jgi:hypothetical protein